jgi:nucleotide-binding universal stress UspA family protein
MAGHLSLTLPFVRSIFHPSDFSEASDLAFVHALAIALILRTDLVIMHAGGDALEDWTQFPPVRKTLERWRMLAPGSPRSAVFEEFAVRVTKVSARGDPVQASIAHIQRYRTDLVVLATRGQYGMPLWLKPSTAQAIARRSPAMTLFVPQGCRGLVSANGVIRLRRVLIPVDHRPNGQEAVIRAVRAAEAFGHDDVEMTLLHVNGTALPRLYRPESDACSWNEVHRTGAVVTEILDAAQNADLIIMSTEGRHGAFDALRGSVTERVVRGAPCPVLAVPARGRAPRGG